MSPYLFVLLPLIGAAVLLCVYWLCREYMLADEALKRRDAQERGRDLALKRLAQELPTIADRKPTRPRRSVDRRKA